MNIRVSLQVPAGVMFFASAHGANEDRTRDRVRKKFDRLFPDSSSFFPAHTMFYFSNEILPGNEFRLVDLKRAPEWR
jgi:hypothetical protein